LKLGSLTESDILPAEVIKTSVMQPKLGPTSSFMVAKSVLQQDGVLGFYRGFFDYYHA
jgi:hypothetical protein